MEMLKTLTNCINSSHMNISESRILNHPVWCDSLMALLVSFIRANHKSLKIYTAVAFVYYNSSLLLEY